MADKSKIEWTDSTWNVITGCQLASPGCTNCYAMRLAGTRLKNTPSRKGLTHGTKTGPVWNGQIRFNEDWLDQPLRWRRPRMIFVCAHGDLFLPAVPMKWQGRIFDVMHQAKRHTFQVLTKRPDVMLHFLNSTTFGPMPHVWLGCSIEDQKRADERLPAMRALAELGWNTWVSYEPALEDVRWRGWSFIKWMVSGGESGPGARPTHPDWHRNARDFALAHGIAYHFKQWGAFDYGPIVADADFDGGSRVDTPHGQVAISIATRLEGDIGAVRRTKKKTGRALDGREWNQFPEVQSL